MKYFNKEKDEIEIKNQKDSLLMMMRKKMKMSV